MSFKVATYILYKRNHAMPIRPSLFLPGRQKFPCKTCKKGSQECSNCPLSFFYTIGMFSSLTIFPYNLPKKMLQMFFSSSFQKHDFHYYHLGLILKNHC